MIEVIRRCNGNETEIEIENCEETETEIEN